MVSLSCCTVSRGVILSSEPRDDLDSTQLTLRLTKLIRATGHHETIDAPTSDDEYYRYETYNYINTYFRIFYPNNSR